MSDDHRRGPDGYEDEDQPYPWMRGDLEEEPAQPFRPWMIAVALASMVIFVVAVWYAWNEGKAVNDGPPPIIQADNSPVKVAPKEPGGLEVPHQDNEVFNALEDGADKRPAEELLPPPEEPVDRPAPAPAPAAQSSSAQPLAAQPVAPAPSAQAQAEPAPTASPPAAVPAPAAQPPAATQPAPTPAPTTPIPTPAPAASTTPPAATATEGAYVIQLAALKSRAAAEETWSRLLKSHTSLLGPLTLDIEAVNIPGQGMFYRVRGAGFASDSDAKARCDALKAQGQACLVKKR